MFPRNLTIGETSFVFDLDDTLYPEIDYQLSGFNEIARYTTMTYGIDSDSVIKTLLESKNNDPLSTLCKTLGLPQSVKESFLWIYRLHEPNLKLNPRIKEVMSKLSKESAGVAILTDGRSVTQRLKIEALGLSEYPAYISEEYCDEKPSSHRFVAIMQDIPARNYIYVGDNPTKDFLAPNRLGWVTLGLKGGVNNMHQQIAKELADEYYPQTWITSLDTIFPPS